MAELSSGSARQAYLERVSQLTPDVASTASYPESSLDRSLAEQGQKKSKSKASTVFWILCGLILSGILAGRTACRAIHPNFADSLRSRSLLTPSDGDLPKPTLTSTPEPTLTPSPTFTSEPTLTWTPEPAPTNTPKPLAQVFIPENILEGERWIDVDLTNQRTYAYEGSTLISTFIVSTGTQYHPTITGQYHIYVKYRYSDMAGPGYYLPDVPFTMYFYQGYSFHGTYWHDNFGVPMSHGCVNMRTADAEWLFYWASIGTLVNIHY